MDKQQTGRPTVQELDRIRITKGELANELYGAHTFDLALPQPWVDACRDRGYDVRGECVWIYRHGFICGEPAALTLDFFNWYLEQYDVCPVCPTAIRDE